MILEVKNLFYKYDTDCDYILKNISFSIEEGSFVGIVGHTGSGKSTLISHFNGLNKATSGEIYYKGINIKEKGYSLKELRKEIALVFQYPEYQLFEETILKDVMFFPKNKGYGEEEQIEKSKNALKLCGIEEELFNKSPFNLSGGQKRRVAIAGALSGDPLVLVLDEPSAGLDPEGRNQIFNMLKNLQETKGLTIIVVSHSMEEMSTYADKIIVLNKGELISDTSPKELFKNKEIIRNSSLSLPTLTEVLVSLKEKGINVREDILDLNEGVGEIIKAL